MVRPRLCDSFHGEQSVGDGSEAPIADYLETIAILQDEVARLEQELQLHEERQRETTSNDEASFRDEAEAASALENVAGEPEEVERLQAELVSREETIRLLLDELSRVEEAQAATQAEWEHLAGWVAELEHRVEGQDADALYQLENRLAAQQQKVDALQVKSEQDRRAWEAKRQIYQAEIARLQGTLEQVTNSPAARGAHDGRVTPGPGPDANVVEALQAENLRLRAAWQELVERASAADRSESLDAKLAETLNEQHQLRRQLEQIQDERKRERLENEANVAELQARLSQASLIQPAGPPSEKGPEGISADQDIQLRFRALRQHLVECDQREKEERGQKHLISRLSRLWGRTGPR
jgi:DNA repair exonuclease SbcCD ATPase subunit